MLAISAIALLAVAAAAAAPARAADPCPYISSKPELRSDSPPSGFRISSNRAVQIALATDVGRTRRHIRPALSRVCTKWVIYLVKDDRLEASFEVDGVTGRVLSKWGGYQARWALSRGSSKLFVGRGTPLILALMAVMFVAPFVDPRRLGRAVHADLLAILAAGASLVFFAYGNLEVSTPMAWAGLAFLLVRMLQVVRNPAERQDVLAPWASPRLLLGAAVVLMAGRGLYNALVGYASDVGYASVFGAQAFLDGFPVYASTGTDLSAYGPATHMAYVPFTALFPLAGGLLRGNGEAAHAAAIGFDVMTVIALYVLGRRLRGHGLGAVLAFGFAANPLTFYPMAASTNDGLIGLFVVLSLLAVASPAGRGVFAGLAAAAKYVPAVIIPLMAAGPRRIERRAAEFFALGAVAAVAAVTIPILPDGGVREIYDVSIGDLAQINSPFSIWGLWGLPEWLRLAALGLVCLFALATAWVPRHRSAATVAALATAILVATQMTLPHWVHWYAAWFLPAALVASFARHERPTA